MNHIVLVHPAIPQNTGNIMRTCVATNTALHIIKPMSFDLDDKKMKRAGLDYIKDLDLHVYECYEDFKKQVLANKEALPTLSEINANIKNNSIASTWKNIFGKFYEGEGELLQKDGKGISYSKFVDGLTLFSKEFAKVNKFDINEPTFYYLANLVYSNIKKD